jgi:hypothetical protein
LDDEIRILAREKESRNWLKHSQGEAALREIENGWRMAASPTPRKT